MAQARVEVNSDGILLSRADGTQSLLLHHELQRVELLCSDQVYFLLIGPQSSTVVPYQAVGIELLVAHLQKLPDFSNAALIEILSCTEGTRLVAWNRPEHFGGYYP